MEKRTRKVDRRIQKTRTAIHEAFVSLLVEKPIEKITVKEIAETANVDRKTVYNYYTGVYDILDYLENEIVKRLEDKMGRINDGLKGMQHFFESLNQVVNENIVFCNYLMKVDSDSRLVLKVLVFLREKIGKELLCDSVDSTRFDFPVEFLTAGMFYSYRRWFNSDRKKPLSEFSKEIGEMIMGGLPSLMQTKD